MNLMLRNHGVSILACGNQIFTLGSGYALYKIVDLQVATLDSFHWINE